MNLSKLSQKASSFLVVASPRIHHFLLSSHLAQHLTLLWHRPRIFSFFQHKHNIQFECMVVCHSTFSSWRGLSHLTFCGKNLMLLLIVTSVV